MSPLISHGRRWMVPMLALVILLAGFAGVALSGGDEQTGRASARASHEVLWLDYFAEELGVSNEELLVAAQRATDRTLDDLVSAGKLTQDQAEKIRARIQRAVQDPEAIRSILRGLRADARPYRELFERVHAAASRALAARLDVNQAELEKLIHNDELDEAIQRAGVSRAELRLTARRAAARPLRAAVDEGLITRRQARLALQKVDAFLAHHI
jgi:ribosomal protein L16 Arg81 hydroxylase